MNPLPSFAWKILGAGLLLASLLLFEQHRIKSAEQRGFDQATTERAARDGVAALRRVQSDAATIVKNDAINKFLTKDHDEKLAPVVAAITAERVRIGPAICAARPAAPTQTESAGGSNGADSAGGLVQGQLERDIRALEIRVEEALAAGRTCQAFLVEQDMAP